MVRALIARVVALSLAFLVVGAVMDSVRISGGFFGVIGLAVVYGLVSGIIGTLLRLIAFPLILITVGLFEFVINAALLLITAALTDALEIDGFMSALGASVLLSVTSVVIGIVFRVATPSRD